MTTPQFPPEFAEAPMPPGFSITPSGLFVRAERNQNRLVSASPVIVRALTRTEDDQQWSLDLAWINPDGRAQAAIVGYEALLARNSPDWLALVSRGLFLQPGLDNDFRRYVALAATLPDMPRQRTIRRLGLFEVRAGDDETHLHFMLPDRCLSPSSLPAAGRERFVFQTSVDHDALAAYTSSGSLADWQAMMRPLADYPLIVFAVAVALAGPFLRIADSDNAIMHLNGQSSTGKTAALQGAASVWGLGTDPQRSGGGRSLVERWNTTANAMEPTAALHGGICLTIDELDSSAEVVLSIHNWTAGRGKARMDRTGALRTEHRWALLVLSSGETTLAAKIEASTGRKARAGELGRGNDIPVAGMQGAGDSDPEAMRQAIERLKTGCGEYFGVAGPSFMQAVLDRFVTGDDLRAELKAQIAHLRDELRRDAELDGHVLNSAHVRALGRFALVAAVGGLAVELGILPFSEDQVLGAVAAASKAWLSALPPLSEAERALDGIRDFVLRYRGQILDFDDWQASRRVPQVTRAIAYDGMLLFTKEAFAEACGGYVTREILNLLDQRGILRCEQGKKTYRVTISGLSINRVAFFAVWPERLLTDSQQREFVTGLRGGLQPPPDPELPPDETI